MGITYFQADPYLISVANTAATIGTSRGNFEGVNFFPGRIASGDQFIAGGQKATLIRNAFSPHAVEMEGAAIAQIAYMNKVPFVIIRAISDSADGSAVLDYQEFVPIAARNASTLLQEMVRVIGQ